MRREKKHRSTEEKNVNRQQMQNSKQALEEASMR
jgi:hypothetical protein